MKTLLLFIVVFLVSSFVSNPKETVSISETTNYSSLNAVLVVGHFEDYEGDQSDKIAEVDKVADYLKSKGINVRKFYNKASDWDKIKESAQHANFFIYAGHGTNRGENGKAGGLCLVETIPSSKIIAEMKLRKNAVVIFDSVCNGAGSSAGDDGDIGINEAVDRVSYYAQPFFKIGAGCYYANNYTDECLEFLKLFFEGKKDVKTAFTEGYGEVFYTKPYQFDKIKEISIKSSEGGGKTILTSYTNGVKTTTEYIRPRSYNVAYVAKPTFSIKDVLSWK